jgi:hypothetical protein
MMESSSCVPLYIMLHQGRAKKKKKKKKKEEEGESQCFYWFFFSLQQMRLLGCMRRLYFVSKIFF